MQGVSFKNPIVSNFGRESNVKGKSSAKSGFKVGVGRGGVPLNCSMNGWRWVLNVILFPRLFRVSNKESTIRVCY